MLRFTAAAATDANCKPGKNAGEDRSLLELFTLVDAANAYSEQGRGVEARGSGGSSVEGDRPTPRETKTMSIVLDGNELDWSDSPRDIDGLGRSCFSGCPTCRI